MRATDAREVALDGIEDGEDGGVARADAEVVQVGFVAVPGAHAADLAVGAVEDDLFALPEPLRRNPTAPVSQHGLSVERLDLEIGGGDAARQRREPDDVARLIEDQRAGRAGTLVRGREHEP